MVTLPHRVRPLVPPVAMFAILGAALGVVPTGSAAVAATPAVAAAPRCGDTLVRDTQLRADLDCRGAALGLRLRPGVLLDLGGHSITVQGTRRAIVVSAVGGRASTTEIRGGDLVGGRGIALTGTDDALDAGRVQRLRLIDVRMRDADLDVTDATARLYRTTMLRPALRMRHGLLDAQRSTLTDVDAGPLGAAADTGNTWNLTDSSVSGAWWSSGDTTVRDSTVIDTAEPGSRSPAYRHLVIDGSSLQGPVYPVTALAGTHSITDSDVDRSGGFVVDDLLTVTGSTMRRVGPLDSGPTGRTVVRDTAFVDSSAATLVTGRDVLVSDSAFRNTAGVAVRGDTVALTRTRLRGGKGPETVSARALTASGNTLTRNAGSGLYARGSATLSGNRISDQGGDGILFADPEGTTAHGEFRVRGNRVLDGAGWGIRIAPEVDPADVLDLGGNVAAGNAAGQCSPPLECATP